MICLNHKEVGHKAGPGIHLSGFLAWSFVTWSMPAGCLREKGQVHAAGIGAGQDLTLWSCCEEGLI